MTVKQIKGMKSLHSKETTEGSLDDSKWRWGMLSVDIIKVMSYGYREQESLLYLKTHDQRNNFLLQRMQECMNHVFIRWNQHNMSSYGNMKWLTTTKELWSSWEWNAWIKEGRDREICNHGKGNQLPKTQEDLTRKSPRKIWRYWWKSGKDEDPWQ